MLITSYPDIVRREGLAVEVVSGFASRSHGEFRRNPPAIVWHHDASPAGPSPGVLDWMISNWDNASANAWVDYNGKWWFVGAGVAWHAGAVLPGMPGNYDAMGIETDYTVGETISWNLYDSLRRGTAAILRANGQTASDLHFHKTICSPVGRKSDPWALDLGTERNAVNSLIRGGRPSLPLPDPNTPGGPGGADPRDWFDMATADELRAIVREEIKGIAENAAEARRLAAVAAGIKSQAVGDEKTPADAVFAKTLMDSTGKGNSFEAFVTDGNARLVRIEERTAPKA